MKDAPIPKFACARCGVRCISWLDGWKHAGGWHAPKSCGQKPVPKRVPDDYKVTKKGAKK